MSPNHSDPDSVEAHYTHEDLYAAIMAALVEAGKDPARLKPEDLAPVDEFHIRGRPATLELAREIGLNEGMHVLDVGSGLGGASRCLVQEFGCRVTGVDLTEEYCRVAARLARLLGLDSRVSYHHGNALAMPFEETFFDVVWTQHAAMNIADKSGLYREIWRVLKPGGMLAIYDVLAGGGGPVHFPVPWARKSSISFLMTPQQMRDTLEETGFQIVSWRDKTASTLAWFRRMSETMGKAESAPLGKHLLLGADFPRMERNLLRNLEEDRIALVQAVAQRPPKQPE
jgi:SAM-dependent methyltransferase